MIPKIIHQVWIGSTIPAKKKMLTETMQGIDGYRYRLWGNEDLTQHNFPLMWRYIVQLQETQKPLAMIADLMRYELMYYHGGVYFDINMELLQESLLQDTLRGKTLVLCNESEHVTDYLSCGFFAIIPRHPALRNVLEVVGTLNNLNTGAANTTTGPYLFYHILHGSPEHLMLPTSAMYPFPPGSKKTCTDDCKKVCPDSISVDHFELGCTWCSLPRIAPSVSSVSSPDIRAIFIAVLIGCGCLIAIYFQIYHRSNAGMVFRGRILLE